MIGRLSIVASPIGNLEDITVRAMRTLLTVDVILCEDTRHTGLLLANIKQFYAHLLTLPVKAPELVAYHEHNENKEMANVLKRILEGEHIALVSDAGTPLVSDPGYPLVRECIAQEIPITVVPGPSSILAALVASGLPPYPFLFLGYLPEKKGKRLRMLKGVKLNHPEGVAEATPFPTTTIILFAPPHKAVKILADIVEVFGYIPIVVAREITKIHEEFIRESSAAVLEKFHGLPPKGELVILFSV